MWYQPNAANVKSLLVSDVEWSVLTDGLPEGTTIDDLVAEGLSAAVGDIRFAVASGGRNKGQAGEIPDECNSCLMPLVRRCIFGRLTGGAADKLFTKTRTQDALRADKKLDDISHHDRGIDPPADVAAVQSAGPPVDLVSLEESGWSHFR